MSTKYQAHKNNWKTCKACPLHKYRCSVVFASGRIPCDVLFLADAPGESEDVIGKPFVGPAGKLLHQMISEASKGIDPGYLPRVGFYYGVGCVSKDSEGNKVHQVKKEHIQACSPKLIEFLNMARPEYIITLGHSAAEALSIWYEEGDPSVTDKVHDINCRHPALILRENQAVRGLLIQAAIASFREVFEEFSIPF